MPEETPISLWLDDLRLPPDGWRWAKTAWEAIEVLETRQVVTVSLDHDLGDDQAFGTGVSVLHWIEEQVATTDFPLPELRIHSMNPVGRRNMQQAIDAIERLAETRAR